MRVVLVLVGWGGGVKVQSDWLMTASPAFGLSEAPPGPHGERVMSRLISPQKGGMRSPFKLNELGGGCRKKPPPTLMPFWLLENLLHISTVQCVLGAFLDRKDLR